MKKTEQTEPRKFFACRNLSVSHINAFTEIAQQRNHTIPRMLEIIIEEYLDRHGDESDVKMICSKYGL